MKQLSFFEEFDSSSVSILDLLKEHVDISELIPYSFASAFYSHNGRDRRYSLRSLISAFLLQKLLTIPTTELLINLLKISKELRDFCEFYNGVPDKTQFSRFKTSFADNLEDVFHRLVDITEPICQSLGKSDAQTLIMDSTGIESYVAENNLKYLQGAIRKANTLIKIKNYSVVNVNSSILANMSKKASANSDVRLQYINGHFAYGIKANLICNAHGILRHMQIDDFDQDIKELEHSKHVSDSTLFVPTLNNFTMLHPNIKAKYICADSGYDSSFNHNAAFKQFGLIPLIDINARNTNDDIPDATYLDPSTPCCPNDKFLILKYAGICKETGRATRIKYICPKTKSNITYCDTPCSSAKCGYIHYEYESHDLRAHPIMDKDCDKYSQISKKRVIIEQVISRLKLPLAMSGTFIRHSKSTKADLFMAGIAHLVTVLLAHRMKLPSKVRSSKSIA